MYIFDHWPSIGIMVTAAREVVAAHLAASRPLGRGPGYVSVFTALQSDRY